MKKEIIIEQNKFDFFLFEEFKIWRCIENKNLLQGFELDIEIEAEKFEWTDIEKFITFLRENLALKMKNILSSKKVLKSYFSEVFKETQMTFEDIDFKLVSVIYKGYCKNINLSNQFEYDFIFYPERINKPTEDFGSHNWHSNFRNNIFLGVHCDRV
jgi:hypothetical protein